MPDCAQAADPCVKVEAAFNALIKTYTDAGAAAIEKNTPADALDLARKATMAGDREASVTMVGISLVLRPRNAMFHLATIRQICGFAEHNSHPLHVASCAYFNALNPIGDPEEKRRAVERGLERFQALQERAAGIAPHMEALEACIVTKPP